MFKIKNANKLPTKDLRQIAWFNRIVMNYLKMCRIEKEPDGNNHMPCISKSQKSPQ